MKRPRQHFDVFGHLSACHHKGTRPQPMPKQRPCLNPFLVFSRVFVLSLSLSSRPCLLSSPLSPSASTTSTLTHAPATHTLIAAASRALRAWTLHLGESRRRLAHLLTTMPAMLATMLAL